MPNLSWMVRDARERLRLLPICALLAGCGPSIHLEGELVIYVTVPTSVGSDRHPGHGGLALLLDSGVERDLVFRTDPDLPPGVRLEVWGEPQERLGEPVGDVVAVERYRVLLPPSPE